MPDPINAKLASLIADGVAVTVTLPTITVRRGENHTFGARQIIAEFTEHRQHGCRVLVLPLDTPVFIGEGREPVDSHFNSEPQKDPAR